MMLSKMRAPRPGEPAILGCMIEPGTVAGDDE